MFVILLISGIVFIPQGHSLKCNHSVCAINDECPGKELVCEPEMTRCGVVRHVSYNEKSIKFSDVLFRSCIKADTCKEASYNFGARQDLYKSQCCDGDLCNTKLVPDAPTRKTDPNGSKCYFCAGDVKCNVTADCTGDQTLCFTDKKGPESVYRGCASKNFCVDPPSIIDSHAFFMTCCEGDLCNSSGRTSAWVLLLLAAPTSLFFFFN